MILNTYEVKILGKDFLTADTISLTLERPENFDYIAGQFTQIQIPTSETKTGKVLRSYSISSTPADKNITFCIKLVSNGKTGEYLKNIKVGETLTISSPLGRFTNDNKEALYFNATGVGIAPIISMIRDELENKKNIQPIRLLFGLRSEGDIFWQDLLTELKNKYPNFDYQFTLSKPSDNWTGMRNRVTAHLADITKKNSHYFVCGSIEMVNDVKTILTKNGIANNNIHFEAF